MDEKTSMSFLSTRGYERLGKKYCNIGSYAMYFTTLFKILGDESFLDCGRF